jgi:hypothetical protein
MTVQYLFVANPSITKYIMVCINDALLAFWGLHHGKGIVLEGIVFDGAKVMSEQTPFF